MDHRIISRLSDDQINQLARLHHRILPSLLTDLGLPIVERYYQFARADSSVISACALDANGSLLGWAIGSPAPNRVTRRISDAWGWFILQMLRILFTRPRVMVQLIASSRSMQTELQEGAVELTYIGVGESARRQGLGRALLATFIESARERKFTSVELSVEAENADAIALYTKVGFKIVASYKEGAFERYHMVLKLQ